MSERIKLTENNFSYAEDEDILEIDCTIDLNITGKDFYDSITKQILEDQMIVDKLINEYGNLVNQIPGIKQQFDSGTDKKIIQELVKYTNIRMQTISNIYHSATGKDIKDL